jgi:hypothetical protein
MSITTRLPTYPITQVGVDANEFTAVDRSNSFMAIGRLQLKLPLPQERYYLP